MEDLSQELAYLSSCKNQRERDMVAECQELEHYLLEAQEANEKILYEVNDKASKCKEEILELKTIQQKLSEEIKLSTEEMSTQEKKIGEMLLLINSLKLEANKVRKEQEKYRSKLDALSNNNEILGSSVRDFSESCNIAEEFAIMEQSSNDVMMSDYDRCKALNIELKAKFRKEQDNYLEVANSRLDLQKRLKRIIEVIDQSENKPNHIVDELNSIVVGVEVFAKAEMSELEEQITVSDSDTGECTDSEYESNDDCQDQMSHHEIQGKLQA